MTKHIIIIIFWKCFGRLGFTCSFFCFGLFCFFGRHLEIYMNTQQSAEIFFLKGQTDFEFFNEGTERNVDANDAEKDAEEDDEAIVSDGSPI